MAVNIGINKKWDGSPAADSTPPYALYFSLSPATGDLIIKIDAPFFNDPPPPVEPCRYDELSDFEVVEVFISGMPNTQTRSFNPYIEIEIGPHGHYFILFFLNEADWETSDNSIMLDMPPTVIIDRDKGRWTSEVAIPSYLLPEPVCEEDMSCNWMCNTFAIHGDAMAATESSREYLAHSPVVGMEPNFHQLSSFVPLKLFETIDVRSKVDRSVSVAKELLNHSKDGKKGSVSGQGGGFTFSQHHGGDLAARLLDDIAENVYEEMLDELEDSTGAEAAAAANAEDENVFEFARKGTDDNSSPGVPPPLTVAQVAQALRDEQLTSTSSSTASLQLGECYQRHIQADEFVIHHGFVWKRKGLSFKKRMLILTSKPRLLYTNAKGTYKGSVPWSLTKMLHTRKINDKKFDIEMADKSRVYHLTDNDNGSDRWIGCIDRLTAAQQDYLKRRGSVFK